MDYAAIIIPIIIGGAFIFYILRSSNKIVAGDHSGLILLKVHSISKITGLILIILSGGLIILAVFTAKTSEDMLAAIAVITLLVFLGLFLLLLGSNYRVEVDEQAITSYSLFNKSSRILWDNVKDMNLNKSGAFVILSGDNGNVKVFIRFVGFVSFAEVVTRKLDEELYNKPFERLSRFGIKVASKKVLSVEDKVRKEIATSNNLKRGSSWFYWIAALSIINSGIRLFDGNLNFVIGLGITQVVDEIAYYLAASLGGIVVIVGMGTNLIITGVFVFFGVMANKGKKWSFIIGMILYGFDTLIFILNKDYLGVGFHCFALYCVYNGFKNTNKADDGV